MEKLKILFWVLMALAMAIMAAGIVHSLVLYLRALTSSEIQSAPAEIAFFLLIPYALASLVFTIAGFIVFFVSKKQRG